MYFWIVISLQANMSLLDRISERIFKEICIIFAANANQLANKS